jgi:hypothetical protein
MIALPTFLILGAAKCGTTTLYHHLRRHPDVHLSTPRNRSSSRQNTNAASGTTGIAVLPRAGMDRPPWEKLGLPTCCSVLQRFLPRRLLLALRNRLSRMGTRPAMSRDTRRWLTRYYEAHNRELEGILDRDLSDWNRAEHERD